MRETNMRGATDGSRRHSFVSGTEVRVTSRKRRERVAVNTVASQADLERLHDLDRLPEVSEITLHVNKRGDVRMITYRDESRIRK